ncbi:MAG: hypothetical protein HKN46_09220 [Acidimicrobiia bacterium]|nr:hypothetical protein [Acidimicrobiia bacterium]
MAAGATVIGGVLAAVGSGRTWFFWLLTVATLANVWLVVVLVRWSGWRGDRTAAVCFSASLALVIGLSGAAAALPSTIPVQWAEQTTAVAAQGLFAWGALRLDRAEAT